MFFDTDDQQDSNSPEQDLPVIPTTADEVLKHLYPLMNSSTSEPFSKELCSLLALFARAVHFSHLSFFHAVTASLCMEDLVLDDTRWATVPRLKPKLLMRTSESVSLGYANSLDALKAMQNVRGPLAALLSQLIGSSSEEPDIRIKSWNAGQCA
ncbi:hypothetical protein CVT24_001473 [Panaeolus cyanescens]|uniref:Uncharacterized protein n=1 Tax=Panaeolus cyanescens TaxID=181874 RepID=A0A409YYV1_9AGAR|nr:hypothetical protein CVT24_001473 [Panaeolus cyanescens]